MICSARYIAQREREIDGAHVIETKPKGREDFSNTVISLSDNHSFVTAAD